MIPAGSNIYKTSDEKWDVLAGTPVTGIKGANETSYRRGNVNLTAEDVGAVAIDGEVTENTVGYDSADVEDGNASLSWLSIPAFTKANVNKVGAMFTNVARLFRNVRYLYKMLGTTDISKIGNGTCTGAISSLNSSLVNNININADIPLAIGKSTHPSFASEYIVLSGSTNRVLCELSNVQNKMGLVFNVNTTLFPMIASTGHGRVVDIYVDYTASPYWKLVVKSAIDGKIYTNYINLSID